MDAIIVLGLVVRTLRWIYLLNTPRGLGCAEYPKVDQMYRFWAPKYAFFKYWGPQGN